MGMFRKRSTLVTLASFFLLMGMFSEPVGAYQKIKKSKGEKTVALTLSSGVFKANAKIPARYTCDGEDVSPPLEWRGAPAGTKSFALISDDPDAPVGTWVHWVIWNVPPDTTSLAENLPKTEKLQNGAQQGLTDFRRAGYGGPCPPSGTHRYFFKLYALDLMLNLPARSNKAQLEAAMKTHILAEAELVGLYSRSK